MSPKIGVCIIHGRVLYMGNYGNHHAYHPSIHNTKTNTHVQRQRDVNKCTVRAVHAWIYTLRLQDIIIG